MSDLPTHDFTAGPAQLNGGYADLQRGASPAPQMGQQAYGASYGATRGYNY